MTPLTPGESGVEGSPHRVILLAHKESTGKLGCATGPRSVERLCLTNREDHQETILEAASASPVADTAPRWPFAKIGH